MNKPDWALDFEAESQYENRKPLVLRKRVRYTLVSLQKLEVGERTDDFKAPKGFKKFFRDQKWFDGWENFGITWDVGTPERDEDSFGNTISDDPLEVVPRYYSRQEEWEDVTGSHVRSDTIGTRKRLRAIKMGEENGSEDNV